jgi:cytochrome c
MPRTHERLQGCAACHANDHSNRAGPGLADVIGRTAGNVSALHFSHTIRRSKIVWDEETIEVYIAEPQKVVPENIMPYAIMTNDQDRGHLIAYLEIFKCRHRD